VILWQTGTEINGEELTTMVEAFMPNWSYQARIAYALNTCQSDYSQNAHIIYDLKFHFRLWFSEYDILVSMRSPNQPAHEQLGLHSVSIDHLVWECNIPAHIA
jgi:hypothetical protein